LSVEPFNALISDLAVLDEQKSKLAQQRGRVILDAAREHLERAGVTEVSTRLRNGDLTDTLAEFEAEAELVVIGKRGEAADFAKLHLGSNVERVARGSKKPVLVTSRAFTGIGNFMIAYDGGPSAMRAVDYIARSPLFSGLACRLVTIGPDNEENRNRIGRAKALLEASGYEVRCDIIPGQAEAEIARVVEQDGVDLLVMGAYGHSRVRSLIIGSTTTEMIRSCKIPIMLFR
jgi:nucleotide-binding universal stress UspA family protein